MTRITYITIFLIGASLCGFSQKVLEGLTYIDQNTPSSEPTVFAKDFISKDHIYEFGSVFSAEGDEFFFAIDSGGRAQIKYSSVRQGKWTTPRTIIAGPNYGFNDPFLSPDEQRLYYISDLPRNSQDTIQDHDIWYSEREGSRWSDPINAGPNINSDADEYYMSFTSDGSMYFSTNKKSRNRNFDIYKSQFANGEFMEAEKLGNAINTDRYEADVFIAPDESYIIFCAIRRGGLGSGDLYISFKNDDGSWTNSMNMGEPINSSGHELCPFVTKDGKYFFYTSQKDIYWVSTDIFDAIKKGSR